MTTAETYDADLAAALALAERFIDPEQCDGNGRCWSAINAPKQAGACMGEALAPAAGVRS